MSKTCLSCNKKGYTVVKCPIPPPIRKEKTKEERAKDMRKAICRRQKIRRKLLKTNELRFCTQQGTPISDNGSFDCFDAFERADTYTELERPKQTNKCKKKKTKKNKIRF